MFDNMRAHRNPEVSLKKKKKTKRKNLLKLLCELLVCTQRVIARAACAMLWVFLKTKRRTKKRGENAMMPFVSRVQYFFQCI